MTRVKVCGLRRAEDVRIVNECLPDYAGFILAPGRRRTVSAENCARLRASLDPRIRAVGVFVDASVSEMVGCVRRGAVDIVQLHGHEGPDVAAALKSEGLTVFQAFVIHGARDLDAALGSPADVVLLDSGQGSGTAFNWELLRGFERPYLLAGGLDSGNIAAALALDPWGVDVSSGVETDGAKDADKVRAFVTACRQSRAQRGVHVPQANVRLQSDCPVARRGTRRDR